MKCDIVDYVVKYQSYHQVIFKHKKPSGTFQRMWEWIRMDFVVGLSKILQKCDSIWVVVDRMTNLDDFILVKINYNVSKLAKIYVKEIVRLHGVPLSIVSD